MTFAIAPNVAATTAAPGSATQPAAGEMQAQHDAIPAQDEAAQAGRSLERQLFEYMQLSDLVLEPEARTGQSCCRSRCHDSNFPMDRFCLWGVATVQLLPFSGR
jgi:hypothetical protein